MSEPCAYKWPALLVVMRHAQSEANFHREYLEQQESLETHVTVQARDADVRLTSEGERQAREAGRYLREEHGRFDAAYISPYRRTRDTADFAIAALDPAPVKVIEERLRERDFGLIESLTRHGFKTLHPGEWERRKLVGKYYYRPPGGESYPDVNLRVHSFLGTLVREHPGQRVLVVTHSVVVLAFRRLIERLGEEEVLDLDRSNEPKNASLSIYESFPGETIGTGLALQQWNFVPKEAACRT
ncbi:MAG TPA: histidine phosphatase family protein [Candidatus Polarisedimenticolia bacterium]|nr:histidine phosphatase family protein [Candidatus Polarisedimenticolia bacterium]